MDLESFTIAMYCRIDAVLAEWRTNPDWQRIRQRGPAPTLADSEVLTMEVVGEYLGLDRDTALFAYFRLEHPDWFPGLMHVHRTTFARHAANLWSVKAKLWQCLLDQIPHDPALSFVDSVPVPVCRFGRAYRCSRFRGRRASAMTTAVKPPSMAFAPICGLAGPASSPPSPWPRPTSTT